MTSQMIFFFFIPILAIILLLVNLIFATHNPYSEKKSPFECGFSSFLFQNRTQFNVSFFIFGLLFLLFDLEILLIYPYSVSTNVNTIYGLVIMVTFFILLTIGFIFELGKKALTISSRQYNSNIKLYNSDIASVIYEVTNLLPEFKNTILEFHDYISNNNIKVTHDDAYNISIDLPTSLSAQQSYAYQLKVSEID
jgi:NADH-ubiquinone oxidoreductase chain 3